MRGVFLYFGNGINIGVREYGTGVLAPFPSLRFPSPKFVDGGASGFDHSGQDGRREGSGLGTVACLKGAGW